MGKKNKVFEPEGQKETTEQLRELFDKHLPSENHESYPGEHGMGGFADPLTQMLRDGARILISSAVEYELEGSLMKFADRKLQDGRAAVVRNGHLPRRNIQTSIGPVAVQIPKVRSRDGSAVAFRSALVPPYVRKSASLEAALPWLYLTRTSLSKTAH